MNRIGTADSSATESGKVAGTPSPVASPPRYAISEYVFTRALACVTACAFVSLWTQIDGLYSDEGITPVRELFAMLGPRADVGFLDLPTLAWLSASSTLLISLCAAGSLACVFLFVGVLPRTALLVAWGAYLSLVNAGMPWTSFQWDLLLVEVLFASVFFVSATRIDRFGARVEPSVAGRWLIWLLLFRLMLRSGIVKLASGDPTWAELSALDYHYFTQPLPTSFGWYAAHLPAWIQRISCALMFGVELALPFLILLPFRWARRTAAVGFVGLMLLITITGNYGFFNLLTLVLAIPLIDDDAWRWGLPRPLVARIDRGPGHARPSGTSQIAAAMQSSWCPKLRASLAAALAALGMIGFSAGLLAPGIDPIAPLRPFRILNDYGLFAVMTTTRPEVEIEGSRDGSTWRPYVFRYKIGPVDRAPVWNTPHQPRLDWQMWFAALGSVRQNPWLVRLMERLVESDPVVLDLLSEDPFLGESPHIVRATLYDYRPTGLTERWETGVWWTRRRVGPYAPSVVRAGN